MTNTIVILGAGFVGISLAHKLLKTTLPKVPGLKVVLVTPNTEFYWNPAAPRAVIAGEIADDKLFVPIEPGFAKYKSQNFEFVLGTATSVDPASNTVIIASATGSTSPLQYDHLIIATGTAMTSPDMPFKLVGTTEATKTSLHSLQERITAAKSIVIAGGGATGIETAAELGEKFGTTKKITLVISGDRPLESLNPKTSNVATSSLQKLKVEIIPNAKVITPAGSNNGGEVELSDGRKIAADLYLPLFGVRPNTGFLAGNNMLTGSGDVKQDSCLRVEGLTNVWAAGDVGGLEGKQIVKAEPQTAHLAQNLQAVLTGGTAKPYVVGKPMMGVTMGRKMGTGEMGGWRVFGFIISMMKGKTMMTEKLPPFVAGN